MSDEQEPATDVPSPKETASDPKSETAPAAAASEEPIKPRRWPKKRLILLILSVLTYCLSVCSWEQRVKTNGEALLEEIFGTKACIGQVDISILRGTICLHDIWVDNPTSTVADQKVSYDQKCFLKIKTITADFTRSSILNSWLELTEVRIQEPVMVSEYTLVTLPSVARNVSNLEEMSNRVNAYLREQNAKIKDTPPERREVPAAAVKRLVVQDPSLHLDFYGYKANIPLVSKILPNSEDISGDLPIFGAIAYAMMTYRTEATRTMLTSVPESTLLTRGLGSATIEVGNKIIYDIKDKASEMGRKTKEKAKKLWQKTKSLFD